MLSRQASCPFLCILILSPLQSCSPGISREMTGDFPHLFVEKGTGASGRQSSSAGGGRLLRATDSAGHGCANLLRVAPSPPPPAPPPRGSDRHSTVHSSQVHSSRDFLLCVQPCNHCSDENTAHSQHPRKPPRSRSIASPNCSAPRR